MNRWNMDSETAAEVARRNRKEEHENNLKRLQFWETKYRFAKTPSAKAEAERRIEYFKDQLEREGSK